MNKKVLIFLALLIITGSIGLFLVKQQNTPFESLSRQQMYQRIIAERNFAIQKAVEAGEYQCCIKPPCTMCYMEANQWNNFEAGTCICDELIAQEKEPCPQCKRDLCEAGKEESCKIN